MKIEEKKAACYRDEGKAAANHTRARALTRKGLRKRIWLLPLACKVVVC